MPGRRRAAGCRPRKHSDPGITGAEATESGDARECRGRVVQVAAKDGANVGVAQDSGKRRLAPEFHEHGQIQHGWYRRVVQGGMVPSGAGWLVRQRASPAAPAQLAVVEAGHGGVQGNDAQPVDEVAVVQRGIVARLVQEPGSEIGLVVVVPIAQMTFAPWPCTPDPRWRGAWHTLRVRRRSARSPVKITASGRAPEARTSAKSCQHGFAVNDAVQGLRTPQQVGVAQMK